MSENKCPFCGEAMITTEDKIVLCENSDCATMFNEWDYPKVAAAMELAKAWSAKNKLSDEEMFKGPITEERLEQLKELNKRIDVSRARVLEVFK